MYSSQVYEYQQQQIVYVLPIQDTTQLNVEIEARNIQASQLRTAKQKAITLNIENRKLLKQLNVEIEAKKFQASQLRTAKQKSITLIIENRKLLNKNKKLSTSLEAIKIELAKLKTQHSKQLESVLQELAIVQKENKLQKDDLKELTVLKNKFKGLDEERCQLKLEVEQQVGKIDALHAVKDMLMKGNEQRDLLIDKYKKMLQNYGKLSSSSDSESQSENSSLTCLSISEPSELKKDKVISSKALHALSLLGAGNTTGPWLCLRCGNCDFPINFLSYAEFRQHLIHVHEEIIDTALCEHCGWRSSSDRELDLHKYKVHKIKSLFYTFSKSAILDKSQQD